MTARLTRRDLGRGALGAAAVAGLGLSAPHVAAAAEFSEINGVKLGMGTGSLNPMGDVPPGTDPIDLAVAGCVACGVTYVELVNGLVEPALAGTGRGGRIPDPLTPDWIANRPKLREYRLTAPISRYTDIRKKFADKGIKLISYVMTFTSDFTEPELEAVFRQADALGVDFICTNQSQVSTGEHLIKLAADHHAKPSWHNHARTDDWDEVASLESLRKLMAMSPNFRINLDIGHFTAGNQDSVAFLREHHARISHIHFKDRKRDNGPNVEWGTGDTPIKPVLQMIKQNRWPIYCVQEREFQGQGTPVEQTRRNFEFMRQTLA